jgi:hypothetical protein
VLALAGTLLATTGAVVSAASDEPDLMTMKLRIEGGYYTEKALSQDSDGDGWTDWVERLNGTDPKDPASHPTISHVEVVGTTAYVQSHQVPDHLVVIDLALPEGATTVTELAAMVASLAGMSEASPLHSQLMAGLDQLGSGRLDEIIKLTQAAHASTGGLPAGAHGRDISLISAGPGTWEAWKGVQETLTFVQNNDIGVGTTTDGDPYVTVTNNEGSQTHVFHGKDSISSTLITKFTDDDGTVVVHWTRIENGVVVGYGKKVTKTDGTQEYWDYDGDGNSTGHGVVQTGPVGGASAGPGPSTGPTAGGQPSSAPSSQPSGEPSSQPSSEPSGDASTETRAIGIRVIRQPRCRLGARDAVAHGDRQAHRVPERGAGAHGAERADVAGDAHHRRARRRRPDRPGVQGPTVPEVRRRLLAGVDRRARRRPDQPRPCAGRSGAQRV